MRPASDNGQYVNLGYVSLFVSVGRCTPLPFSGSSIYIPTESILAKNFAQFFSVLGLTTDMPQPHCSVVSSVDVGTRTIGPLRSTPVGRE